MKTKEQQPDLIQPPSQAWTIHTHPDQVTHELRYLGKSLSGGKVTATYDHGRRKLEQLCALYNKHEATPLPPVQCAADAVSPSAYLARHAGKNQTLATDEA